MKATITRLIFGKYKWILLCTAIAGFFLFLSEAYGDFYQTMRHGITFWDALFHGDFLKFYEYCAEGGPGYSSGPSVYRLQGGAAYDITIYILFAIWNFPMWVIEKILSIDVQNTFWGIVYGKGLIVLFLLISVKELTDIGLLTEQGRIFKDELFALYLSSVFVLLYVVATGNYDVITVSFVLYGLKNYLKGNTRRFIGAFAIANTIKYLSLFLFIPLVLLEYKKAGKIVWGFIQGLFLIVIEKLVFALGGAMPTEIALSRGLLANQFEMKLGNYSLFILAYCFICFLAWKRRADSEEQRIKDSVLIGLTVYGSFLFFGDPYPYWIIFLVPFLELFLIVVLKDLQTGILLETFFSFFWVGYYFLKYGWVPDGYSCLNMLLYWTFGKRIYEQKGEMKVGFPVGVFLGAIDNRVGITVPLASMGFASFAILLILFCLQEHQPVRIEEEKSDLNIILRIRGGVMLFVAILPPLVYLAQMLLFDFMKLHFPTFF